MTYVRIESLNLNILFFFTIVVISEALYSNIECHTLAKLDTHTAPFDVLLLHATTALTAAIAVCHIIIYSVCIFLMFRCFTSPPSI